MPQLQYLDPDADDNWDSSPSSPNPSPSPSPSADKSVPRPSPTPSSHRIPSPSRSPRLYANKRIKIEVIDLESTPDTSVTAKEEDSASPSPDSDSKLLNSSMKNVPHVRKEEWSDDSSDEDQEELAEEVELYHKPPHTSLKKIATTMATEHVETDGSLLPKSANGLLDGLESAATLDGSQNSTSNTTTDPNPPKRRYGYYTQGYRFPKVPRKELQNYIFLAACVKHAGDRFKPDAKALATELGISPTTVKSKLCTLRKRLEQEGADFGKPGLWIYNAQTGKTGE